MALFPGLPRWVGTRKVKPIWVLLKQETVSGSGISWAICKYAPCSRQITTPAPTTQFFTGQMPFLPPNQQRQSTEGTSNIHMRQQQIVTHWQYATLAFSACQKRINSRIASRTVEQSAYQYTNIIDNQRRKNCPLTDWLHSYNLSLQNMTVYQQYRTVTSRILILHCQHHLFLTANTTKHNHQQVVVIFHTFISHPSQAVAVLEARSW